MSADCYFVPSADSPSVSLDQLSACFHAAGLPTSFRSDSELHGWFVFSPHHTQLYVSLRQGAVAFLTLEASSHDSTEVLFTVEQVLVSAEFSVAAST